MKVLTISHMYPSTFNEVSGIFVHEQVKALKEKGVKVKVVSPVPWTPFPINKVSKKWERYSMIPEFTNWDGIKVWYPRYLTFPKALFFASSGKRMYWGIKNLVKKLYRDFKFDLIHAHVALPDGYAAMELAQDLDIPFVVTIHGADLYITIKKNTECLYTLKQVFKRADRIILVSHELKKILSNYFEVSDKLLVIGNGIPINKIYTCKDNADLSNNKNKGLMLLSASYLIERKGIDYNLRALSKLINKYPELRYIIAGDGVEKNKLQELAKELGVYERVEFIGMLSHDDVLKYMSEADIFSLPSWNEAFGVVYIEAMACGKPVIGCEGEGLEDFVRNFETGLLVKPKDVNSLAEAMDFLLSNPDKAKEIGKRGQKLVLDNYTWEKNAEKTIRVYQEVLDDVR